MTNTIKSQLTPASTLSGLNKFKHFLALGLLITGAKVSKSTNKTQSKDWVFCVAKRFKQITVQHLNVIFLVLVMAIYKKAFTFVGFGSCLGVSRSTGLF
jgi:hypothetical protein